jgi:hypothetical protein
MRIIPVVLLILAAPSLPPANAQRPEGGRRERPEQVALEGTTEPGIAWFGVLADARAEAQRTGKPILLMSAAPACTGVPGMW